MTDEPGTPFDVAALRAVMARQDGVVSAQQLREVGARPHDVKRLLRRRELSAVHRGVYVDHTGPPTPDQQAWAAVLALWPAALTGRWALLDPPPGAVHVAVDLRRTVVPPAGVVVHRTAGLAARVRWQTSPPRMRVEHAVIDLASTLSHDPTAAFGVLADACQTRRTTPRRLARVLDDRARVRGRDLLRDLLSDLETGACSVLEREWLRVEAVHGLPVAQRQRRARSGQRLAYRDASHDDFGLVVELDGKAFHDTAAARDRDAERDLDAAVDGLLTVRLTYGQVHRRGCASAARVGQLLVQRGWSGSVTPCGTCTPARS